MASTIMYATIISLFFKRIPFQIKTEKNIKPRLTIKNIWLKLFFIYFISWKWINIRRKIATLLLKWLNPNYFHFLISSQEKGDNDSYNKTFFQWMKYDERKTVDTARSVRHRFFSMVARGLNLLLYGVKYSPL